MKTFNRSIYFMVVCLALIIAGCSNDDNSEDGGDAGGTAGGEFFRAKVDGADFSASTDPATLIGGTKSTGNNTTVVSGQGSTNTAIL